MTPELSPARSLEEPTTQRLWITGLLTAAIACTIVSTVGDVLATWGFLSGGSTLVATSPFDLLLRAPFVFVGGLFIGAWGSAWAIWARTRRKRAGISAAGQARAARIQGFAGTLLALVLFVVLPDVGQVMPFLASMIGALAVSLSVALVLSRIIVGNGVDSGRDSPLR
jgi:hypothetical protein